MKKNLIKALEKNGYRVGMYTGEDKTGFDQFIKGHIDVLIGSSAIGTGVDGLQNVSNQSRDDVLKAAKRDRKKIMLSELKTVPFLSISPLSKLLILIS